MLGTSQSSVPGSQDKAQGIIRAPFAARWTPRVMDCIPPEREKVAAASLRSAPVQSNVSTKHGVWRAISLSNDHSFRDPIEITRHSNWMEGGGTQAARVDVWRGGQRDDGELMRGRGKRSDSGPRGDGGGLTSFFVMFVRPQTYFSPSPVPYFSKLLHFGPRGPMPSNLRPSRLRAEGFGCAAAKVLVAS